MTRKNLATIQTLSVNVGEGRRVGIADSKAVAPDREDGVVLILEQPYQPERHKKRVSTRSVGISTRKKDDKVLTVIPLLDTTARGLQKVLNEHFKHR